MGELATGISLLRRVWTTKSSRVRKTSVIRSPLICWVDNELAVVVALDEIAHV